MTSAQNWDVIREQEWAQIKREGKPFSDDGWRGASLSREEALHAHGDDRKIAATYSSVAGRQIAVGGMIDRRSKESASASLELFTEENGELRRSDRGESSVPAGLDGVQSSTESEREVDSSQDQVGSIEWYSELQRAYWNAAFPDKQK